MRLPLLLWMPVRFSIRNGLLPEDEAPQSDRWMQHDVRVGSWRRGLEAKSRACNKREECLPHPNGSPTAKEQAAKKRRGSQRK